MLEKEYVIKSEGGVGEGGVNDEKENGREEEGVRDKVERGLQVEKE